MANGLDGMYVYQQIQTNNHTTSEPHTHVMSNENKFPLKRLSHPRAPQPFPTFPNLFEKVESPCGTTTFPNLFPTFLKRLSHPRAPQPFPTFANLSQPFPTFLNLSTFQPFNLFIQNLMILSDVLTCTVPPLRVESSLLKNPRGFSLLKKTGTLRGRPERLWRFQISPQVYILCS